MTCIIMVPITEEGYDKPNQILVGTDLEATYGYRESRGYEKINIKDRYVATFTGRVDNGSEIVKKWKTKHTADKFEEELMNFKDSFFDVYISKLEDIVLKECGVSLQEYKKGEISSNLRQKLDSKIDIFSSPGESGFGTYFLFGGYNESNTTAEIYTVSPPSVLHYEMEAVTRGTGSDRAQIVLMDYYENLPKEKKNKIPLLDAVRIATKALVNASKNIGVGGIDLAIAGKDGVERFSYEVCNLLYNITFKEWNGDISKESADKYFKELIIDKVEYKKVAKKIFDPMDSIKYLLSK